jgi:hypothetical protein
MLVKIVNETYVHERKTHFFKIGFTMKTFSLKTLLMGAVSLMYTHSYYASERDDNMSSKTRKAIYKQKEHMLLQDMPEDVLRDLTNMGLVDENLVKKLYQRHGYYVAEIVQGYFESLAMEDGKDNKEQKKFFSNPTPYQIEKFAKAGLTNEELVKEAFKVHKGDYEKIIPYYRKSMSIQKQKKLYNQATEEYFSDVKFEFFNDNV